MALPLKAPTMALGDLSLRTQRLCYVRGYSVMLDVTTFSGIYLKVQEELGLSEFRSDGVSLGSGPQP